MHSEQNFGFNAHQVVLAGSSRKCSRSFVAQFMPRTKDSSSALGIHPASVRAELSEKYTLCPHSPLSVGLSCEHGTTIGSRNSP